MIQTLSVASRPGVISDQSRYGAMLFMEIDCTFLSYFLCLSPSVTMCLTSNINCFEFTNLLGFDRGDLHAMIDNQ